MLHECGLLIEVLECAQQGREDLLSGALVDEDLLYLLVRDLAFLGRALHVDLQVLLADLLVLFWRWRLPGWQQRLAQATHVLDGLDGLILHLLEEEVVEWKERRREGGTMWSPYWRLLTRSGSSAVALLSFLF